MMKISHIGLYILKKTALMENWTLEDESFMREALSEATKAMCKREVPVGCVITRGGQVVARGHNLTNEMRNGCRHAEFQAIDELIAASGGDMSQADLKNCCLYVTVEPCIMCAGALSLVGMGRVVFGCGNDKFGGCGSILSVHVSGCGSEFISEAGSGYTAVGGLMKEEAIKLLQDFYCHGNPAAPQPHRPLRAV